MRNGLRNVLIVSTLAVCLAGCEYKPTANDIQRQQQQMMNAEGARQVGMPKILNYREMRLLKMFYEMRDQEDLATYTYIFVPMTGKWVHYCNSIGFPIPYSTQYSGPTAMQTYNVGTQGAGDNNRWGVAQLPQPEPNGIFPPSSSDATFVMCIGPDGSPKPAYSEDKLDTFLWPLPPEKVQK
jgi:hypothetical protein